MNLLEKTRLFNKILQKNKDSSALYDEIAHTLSDLLECNTYIINANGHILSNSFVSGFNCSISDNIAAEKTIPESYNDSLLSISATVTNTPNTNNKCVFEGGNCGFGNKLTTVIPVNGGGQRIGTLLISKFDEELVDNELIMAEYAATIIGMISLKDMATDLELKARSKFAVQLAIGTLSYSELEAVKYIFEELNSQEGILVASKIADRVGITRSVIVNALRKLESANIIESKSLGMKGTYIRVLNGDFLTELENTR